MSLVLFLKSLVAGYTRRDGTVVAPHSDKRTKRTKPHPGQLALFEDEKKPIPPTPLKGLDPVKATPDMFEAPTAKTDTPAFKKWFGDSKVVDGSGNPMKMFHGTTAEFSEFKQGTGMLGNGIYFTTKPDRAGLYPKMHNIQEKAAGREEKPINVMPVYLRMTNPLTMDELPVGGIDTKKIQEDGYDGVIHGHQYLVFSPNQIKSATGNNGDYSDHGDITKAVLFIKAKK